MFYKIVLTGLMLCTDYQIPLVISDLKFRPECTSQVCQSDALMWCLEALYVLPGKDTVYECMWRKE